MEEKVNRANASAKLVSYIVLAAVSIVGIGALAVRFSRGLIVTNMTQHVPWGFWIAFYIYFIGLSAGSFLLSTLVYVFRVKRLEAVGPLALIQALICMLLGLALVFVDLGHPERFLNVFIHWNPTSVLAWECFFYTGYIVIIVAELFFALRPALAERAREGGPLAGLYRFLSLGGRVPDVNWRKKAERWLKTLGMVGIPVAIGVHGGTGAIFAVVKSRPTWYTGLLPIIFLVSAVVSGGALLTFLTATVMPIEKEKKLPLIQSLARLTIGVLAFDLLLMCSEVQVTFYGGIPNHIVAWKLILFGHYWWLFWFVQLGLGALAPIVILMNRRTLNSVGWLGAAGLLVVLGVVGVRINVVIPPLMDPEFAALPAAYHHFRFAVGYFPSLDEWLVGLGIVALGVWVFLGTLKLIPLDVARSEHASEGGASL